MHGFASQMLAWYTECFALPYATNVDMILIIWILNDQYDCPEKLICLCGNCKCIVDKLSFKSVLGWIIAPTEYMPAVVHSCKLILFMLVRGAQQPGINVTVITYVSKILIGKSEDFFHKRYSNNTYRQICNISAPWWAIKLLPLRSPVGASPTTSPFLTWTWRDI